MSRKTVLPPVPNAVDYRRLVVDHIDRRFGATSEELDDNRRRVRIELDKLRRSFSSPPEKIFVNLSLHFTVWCSGGDFESHCERNLPFFHAFFRRARRWPGRGMNIHFEIFDFETIRERAPEVWDDLCECVSNGAIELVKGGLIDYSAIVTPLDDIVENHTLWNDYVKRSFGIDTNGLFVWPNELQYHPNLPSIWNRMGIGGIVLTPFSEDMRVHNCEPLTLLGEDGSESVLVPAVNEDCGIAAMEAGLHTGLPLHMGNVSERYFDFVRRGYIYSSLTGWKAPVLSIAQDLTNVEPPAVDHLLRLLEEDPVAEQVPLTRIARELTPRYRVKLDQGNWDTHYTWHLSSEGWFTGSPWHLHMNGLSYRAHRMLKEARFLAEAAGDRSDETEEALAGARDHLLYSERSTSRAHWAHPSTRLWAQNHAAAGIEASSRIISKASAKARNAGEFELANPDEEPYEGLVFLAVAEGADINGVIAPSGAVLPAGVVRPSSSEGAAYLAFQACLPARSNTLFRATNDRTEATCAAFLQGGKHSLTNGLLKLQCDASRGGRMAGLAFRGRNFLTMGGAFSGRVLDDAPSGIAPGTVLDDPIDATAQILSSGGFAAGIRINSRIAPGIAKSVEYWVFGGSEFVLVDLTLSFDSPVWFEPEGAGCARFVLAPEFPLEFVRWNMPGGWLGKKAVIQPAAFDTFGGVTISSAVGQGLSVVARLYPNGVRMFALNNGELGLCLSGANRVKPYEKSNASFGAMTTRFAIVPEPDENSPLAPQVHRLLNAAPILVSACDPVLNAPERPHIWPDSRF